MKLLKYYMCVVLEGLGIIIVSNSNNNREGMSIGYEGSISNTVTSQIRCINSLHIGL